MGCEAFQKRMKHKTKLQRMVDKPHNTVDRIVEHLLRRFNHLTRNMNDQQRMVTARILSGDLRSIDVDTCPHGKSATRKVLS